MKEREGRGDREGGGKGREEGEGERGIFILFCFIGFRGIWLRICIIL